MKFLFATFLFLLTLGAEKTLFQELQGYSQNIKLILFSNDDWEGDKILPSNEDYVDFCEKQEQTHAEVTCIIVDSIKDETVRPLMKKAHILKDNTPALMVH